MGTIPRMGRNEIEDRFAKRVRSEREFRGWSQAELASRLSDVLGQQVYPTTVAKIESRSGEKLRSIKLDEAVGLARLFEVSVEDIVGLSDTPPRGRAEIRNLLAATARQSAVSIGDAAIKLQDGIAALLPRPQLLLENLDGSSAEQQREIFLDSRLAGALLMQHATFLNRVHDCQHALNGFINVTELSDEELLRAKMPETVEDPQKDAIRKIVASKLHPRAGGNDSTTE